MGFWVLRGLFGGPDASPNVSREEREQPLQETEEIETPEMTVELVEPPSAVGTISPTGLLRRMYPSLWSADGFCWEEAEAAYDSDSPRIDTGLFHGADPPADLLEFLADRGESYDDYGYRWFNRRQLLFMHQEMSVTEGGRSGPSAGVTRVVRREAPDGRQFWDSTTARRCTGATNDHVAHPAWTPSSAHDSSTWLDSHGSSSWRA